MKLATLRRPDGTTVAARVDDGTAIELVDYTDVGDVLRRGALAAVERVTGPRHVLETADLAPVVVNPGKIVCVGLNYRNHIREMGRELPEYPTLFTKFANALIGPRDLIQIPPESAKIDWEGELVVVVGSAVRRADDAQARAAIAGYTVMNDVTMRDYQYRTPQWFQGKAWEASTPLGPVFATPDELPADAELVTRLDGEEMQRTRIDDLVFDAVALVRYISTIFTLEPGDIIATGTPGGVGHARTPGRYVGPGQTVTVSIDGIGELANAAAAEHVPSAGSPVTVAP